LSNVEAYVTDAAGNHIWSAKNNLSYTVAGAGRSFGIGTGYLNQPSPIVASSRPAWEGRAYIPVQSTTTPGSITVTVSSNGLTAGTLTLSTVPQPGGTTGIKDRSATVPKALSFNLKSGLHSVEMDYRLNQASPVRISVLLPDGRTVADFDEGIKNTGSHSWSWNAASGEHAYFVRLKAGPTSITKMIVVP